ncbi:MAG: rhomboid family intramembrane serine protease [Gemmatimonadota bacterium]|jgi:membrane associated rhomboid family serine protease|nr:rhomboid family intramembrane serine protease [Gemmatimonadota bacterium]MDP7031800.1 rhomboid family intramembrane serine protease [Gemmatimonadota bacterium]
MTRFLLVAISGWYAVMVLATLATRSEGGLGVLLKVDRAVLLHFGANHGALVRAGEVWRLATSCLLHANAVHLVANGFALFVLGRNLEAFYGAWSLLFLFLISGIAGSAASAFLSETTSVGASGGIFGLLGASLVFSYLHRDLLPKRVIRIMGTALVPWVVFNVVVGMFFPVIDANAHIGGLLAGAAVAFYLPVPAVEEALGRRRDGPGRALGVCALGLMLVSLMAGRPTLSRMVGSDRARWDSRVMAIIAVGERAQDMRVVNERLRREPDVPSLWRERARLHARSALWVAALEDYRRAVRLAGEAVDPLEAVDRYLRAAALAATGETEAAEAAFELALRADPTDPGRESAERVLRKAGIPIPLLR